MSEAATVDYKTFLKAMNRGQKSRLSRYECGWCGQELHRPDCGSMYEKCDAKTQIARAGSCLKEYKPRVSQ